MPEGFTMTLKPFNPNESKIYDCVEVFMLVYTDHQLMFSKNEVSLLSYLQLNPCRLKERNVHFLQRKVQS